MRRPARIAHLRVEIGGRHQEQSGQLPTGPTTRQVHLVTAPLQGVTGRRQGGHRTVTPSQGHMGLQGVTGRSYCHRGHMGLQGSQRVKRRTHCHKGHRRVTTAQRGHMGLQGVVTWIIGSQEGGDNSSAPPSRPPTPDRWFRPPPGPTDAPAAVGRRLGATAAGWLRPENRPAARWRGRPDAPWRSLAG